MNRLNHVRGIAAVCAMLLISGAAAAAPFTSSQSGNWNLSSTWGGAGVPGTGDDVTITSNHVVTVSDPRLALTVTLDSATGNKMLVITNTGNLLVESALPPAITISAPGSGSTNIIRIDGGILETSDSGISITGGASDASKLEFTALGGTAIFGGDISFAGTAANAQIDMAASGSSAVSLTGDLGNDGTLINNPLSSFEFNGSGPQTINAYTFARLEIDKTGGTATLNGAITVDAELNVSAGVLDDGGYQIGLDPGLTSDVSVGATGVLKLGSAASATTFPSPVNAVNVLFLPGSAVVYQGGVAQTINGDLFYKRLYVSTMGAVPVTKTFSGANLFVEEQLDVTDNGSAVVTLDVAAAALDVDANITGDGTIALTGGTINIGGNWSSAMTLTAPSGTVTYDGTGAQSALGATYPDLAIAKLSGAATFNGNATISGALSVTGAGTLSAGANIVTLLGDATVDSTFDVSLGTLRFNGAATQTLNQPFSSLVISNLEINNALGAVISSSGTTIDNALTLNGGKLLVGGPFTIDAAATVTRNSGWLVGPVTMGMNPTPARRFHIGTVSSYLPVDVDAASAGTVTIDVVEGQSPDKTGPNVLDRYWKILAPSTVSSLDSITFNYNLSDVTTGNEANYILAQYDTTLFLFTHYGSVNTGTHTVSAAGVPDYVTDWVIGEPGSLAAASQLAITSINTGTDPTVNVPFEVVVESRDDNGDITPVFVDTDFTLSEDNGSGVLGGTLTGTILAGTDTASVTGVTYDTVETGLLMRATRTSGDVLTDGTLAFDVAATPSTITVSNVDDSGAGSLREAITTANSAGCTTPCTIDFSTSGEIVLLTALPAITLNDLTIDGYSAPSASANTNAFGLPSNANITLELDGSNSIPFGFQIQATNVKITGFAITNFVNAGVRFSGTNTGSNVSGCHIGTDPTGLLASANAGGVLFNGSTGASLGGSPAAARNIISGNSTWGATIDGLSSGITLSGNYVGPRANLTGPLANNTGIIVADGATSVVIGVSGAGNVVSGNIASGIVLAGDNASVVANLIGTAGSANTAIANATGIQIDATAAFNSIGGASPTHVNVISGHSQNGILINGDDNLLDNNIIGLGPDGTTPLGNGASGIRLDGTAARNRMGVSNGNKIVNSTNDGVSVATTATGIGNVIRRSKIAGNGNRGIDLADDGTTANDATDADTGANNLQNFPAIVTAKVNGSNLDVRFSLDSTGGVSATNFVIEVFEADGSSPAQAAAYLGNSGCLAGSSFSNTLFSVPVGTAVTGDFVVATATAYSDSICSTPSEGTSELSPSVRVSGEIHWIAGSGNWETPANWSPVTVPTSTDDAFIDNPGTYTVTINTIASVASVHVGAVSGAQILNIPGSQSLTFTNASTVGTNGTISFGGLNLGGAGPLSVSGLLEWNGGTLSGGGGVTINSGGGLNINSASNKFLQSSLLTIANGATANWNGGSINLVTGGAIDNFGLFESKTDANIADGGTPGSFDNAGTFRKSTTGGVTQLVNVTFNHSSGTVDVQTGRLNLAGGTASAPFTIASGADVYINDNIYLFATGTSTTGPGKVHISGGTLNVAGPSVLIEHLLLDSGTLGGTGTARSGASGSWVWSGGTMGGSGSSLLEAGSSLSIGTATAKTLDSRTLTIQSGVNAGWFSTGVLQLANGGNIANAGIFDAQDDASIVNSGAAGAFVNSGTFKKSAGAGTTAINNVTFNDTGTVQVQTGTLNPTNVTSSGAIQLTGVLLIDDGVVTLNGASDVSGGGLLRINGGTLAVDVADTLPNVQLDIGFLQGTAIFDITSLVWNGGTMQGAGTTNIPNPGSATIATASAKSLQRSFSIASGTTVNVTGNGAINLSSGGNISNAGLFDFAVDGLLNDAGGDGGFLNTGTFRKSAGAGVTSLSNVDLTSSGTIDVQTGTLNPANVTASGPIQLTGSFVVDDGTVTFNAGTDVSGTGLLQQTSSVINANAVDTLPNVQLDGGTFQGTANVSITSLLWNTGTMDGAGTTTIPAGATATLATPSGKILRRTLSVANTGTVTVSGTGAITLGTGGNVLNAGLFQINSSLSISDGGSAGDIANTGTFRSNGPVVTLTGVTLNNTGGTALLDVLSGSLDLADGTSSGPITIDAAGVLLINSDTYTLATGTTVSGTGPIHLNGGTLSVTGNIDVPRLDQNAGTVDGTGTLTLSNVATWTNGIMQGAGTTSVSGALDLSSASAKSLNRSLSITGTGTVNLNGTGTLNIGTGGSIANAGTFLVTVDSSINDSGSGGNFTNNATGIFRKMTATGTTFFTGIGFLNNGGLVDLQTGILNVNNDTFTQSSGTLKLWLGGTSPGIGFSQVVTDQSPNLAGELEIALVGLYQPIGGDAFLVLSAATHTGDFAPYTYPALAFGRTFSNAYTGSGLLLTVNGEGDLAIDKSGPSNVLVGDPIAYTLQVDNNGPDTANSLSVTDTLEPGHTGISASGTGWSCNVVVDTVTCTMPSLAMGSANPITINATAPASPTNFINFATVTSSNDSDTGDNSANWSVTVDPYQADLELTAFSPATPLAPGTPFTFDFTIANNGPQTATAVVFTAPIPTTIQYDNATPDAGSCNFASDTVTCNVGNILSGDDLHVVLDLTTVDPGTHTVTGTGTATELDPNPGNNSIPPAVSVTGSSLTVSNTDDTGAGSLRQALEDVDNGVCSLPCGIDFNIGSGPFVIQPATELPAIGDQVLLDATTQPGYSGVPIIEIDAAPANLIAGLTLDGTGSAIKGFSIQGANIGVKITGNSNAVEASYIGLTPSDIAAANGDGIEIAGDDNTVGGSTPAQRNIISGNTNHGVLLSGTATGNDVAGNYIGTDSAGTSAMPQDIGVEIIDGADSNTIGGATAGHGNVIAGNQNYQIYIAGSGNVVIAGGVSTNSLETTDGNLIFNNAIGADATGTATLGAAIAGIAVMDNAIGTQIGAPDQGNVIGGNDVGIILSGGAEQSIIAANQIGRALDQSTNIANTQSGIVIDASNNLVGGGLFNGHNNIINNGNDGITVLSGIGNRFLVNSIYDNGDRGIDLGDDGLTPNDAGDADTGPNNLQNSPTLTDVLMLGGGEVHIAFNFDSSATVPAIGSVRVEMFEADSNGQGAQFFNVGCHAVNSAGIGSTFNAPSITLGMPVVLTMTSYADGSCTNIVDGTSEFSNAVVATACAPPAVTITGPTSSCAGGTVVLDAGPGFSEYLWSNGEMTQQITVAPTITTIYTVTVKDGVGCPNSDNHTVNVNPLPTPTITGPASVCATGSVVLDAGPGYTGYLWSTGAMTQQITVSPAITTNYSVTVTDGNTCQGTDSHTVTVNSNPTVTITGPTSMCAGANVVLDAGPGFASYAWSTGEFTQQITVSPAITTNYSVTVTDGNGCTGVDSHNVTVHPLPAATITPGGPTTFCTGGSVILTASAGASWLWSNGATSQQITVNATGSFSVQVTSAAGCNATSAPTSVTVNPLPAVTITGPTSSCAGAPVLLDAGPGFAGYLWSNGALTQQITVNPAITTNYSVTVTDGNSCQGTDSHTVTVTTSPAATINVAPNVCQGSTGNTASVATQPGATYVWSITNGTITNGAGTNAITFTAGISGTVDLDVTVTSGSCVSTGDVSVPIVPPPTVTITGPTASCANASVTLDAGAGFATYVWSNGATTPTITVASNFTTTYTVNVTTASGCTATDSHTVTITAAPSAVITAPSGADANETGLAASVAAQPGATYTWSVVNGTLTSGNGTNAVVFAAGASGVTEVRVTVTLNGCSSTFEHFVFIDSNGAGADLLITKTAPASVQVGSTIAYAIGVTNLGPEAATGVVITDNIPAGTSFAAVSGGPWTCVPTVGGIRCTGNAAAGSNSTITLTVNAPQQSGNVTNTAQVTAATSDPNPANNSASAATSVVAAPQGNPCVTRAVATALAPANNAVLNASSVEFRWTAVHGAGGYRLFASIDGAPPAVLGTTRETFLRTTIGRGEVVWFIQTLYDGCAATESARSLFTIPTRSDCTTQNPETLAPLNGSTTNSASVTFSWSGVPGAVLYELWLSLDNGSPTLVGTTQGTTLTQLVPPGNLHWFVRAIVERCGPRTSQRSRFTFTPPVACATLERPIPIAPLFGAVTNAPLGFLWSDVGASSYDLYVRRGEAVSLVATTNAPALSGVSLAPGKIRWFVRARFSGNCSPMDSAEQELEIVATPSACAPLSAPIIAAPGQISSAVPFFIQWLPVSGATSYELQLGDSAGFANAQTISTSSTLHEIVRANLGDEPLAVFARVRAIDARCAPPAPGSFGPTSAIFILPDGSEEGSAPVIGGNVTFTIALGPELAGQMFNAVAKQPWLTVMPASGFVRESGTELTVTADTDTLPLGTSLGAVTVTLDTFGAGKVAANSTTVNPSFSVSLVTPIMPDPSNTPPPDALIIPAIAHADGINSHFQSDVRVSNTSPRLINYQLTYTPSGQGIGSGQQTTFSVEPGRTIALDDILKSFFGTGTGSAIGTLEIRPLTETTDSTSSAPFNGLLNLLSFATSRTFNVTANGTFGQYIPAIPFANFIGRAAAGDVRRVLSLQQIAQSPQYRTNLGLLEGSGQNASVIVRIFGNAGEYLTEFPVNLQGGQHLQLNGFLAAQGVDPITDGRVEVEVLSEGGKVTAYASVLDNATSDPLLVTPVSVADSGASKWVMPGVADLASGFANWQTDMRLFNAGTEAVEATLLFYSQNGGEPKTANITIPAGQVRQFDRALTSIFNTTNDGGAVHITTPAAAKLIATARTYNQTTTGTYGQFISAVTLAEAASLNTRPLQLLQVEESDRFRSNVGLVEMSGKPVVLEISIVPPDAKFTAVTEVPLAANEFRQLGSLLASFGLDDTHNARVTVRVISGEGLVTAYASVIDMQTNDPTYVPAQ